MNGQAFYFCAACGSNLAGTIKHSGVPMCCCNREMELLQANQGDFAKEHVIHTIVDGNRVSVTVCDEMDRPHPMDKGHHIEWIYLHTQARGERKMLRPGERPEAVFLLERMESAIVYAYCGKRGLWEKALPSPAAYGTNGQYDR